MRLYDPIYGERDIPEYLNELIFSPEVRRLTRVRLLNTLTPSLPTLGDLRRFSHTMGVLALSIENPLFGFTTDEIKAFQASVLIHDAATPPFAHLLEYFFREKENWHHEAALLPILLGTAGPENSATQIFMGQTTQFKNLCGKANISFDLVTEIISGQHPLSHLLFGSLDLDNIDNVARMAWALGQKYNPEDIISLVRKIEISPKGELKFPKSALELIQTWMRLRRHSYEIVIYDEYTVASQAILSHFLEGAIDSNQLKSADWQLTDEDILKRLLDEKDYSTYEKNTYLGRLPTYLFPPLTLPVSLKEMGFNSRGEIIGLILERVKEIGLEDKIIPYVFSDNGSFEKKLSFIDPADQQAWSVGEKSQHTIIYIFKKHNAAINRIDAEKLKTNLLYRFELKAA